MTETLIPRRPHNVAPTVESIRLILAIKNFAATPGVCHIGLGVTALNTMRVLRRNGIDCQAWSAQTAKELYLLIEEDERKNPARPITHVVISAPSWVQPESFGDFSIRWPDIVFVQLNHSGLAYLSIDRYGIKNIRAVSALSLVSHNIRVAGNNRRLTRWFFNALDTPELYLPNLYDTTTYVEPVIQRRDHDPLRIGSFGAGRPWKNQLLAAEAAVQMARNLGVNLELYVNTQRPDGGERMIVARKELFDDLPNAKLIEVPWALWPIFRRKVATMDIMISPSFDETFCVICADGIAEGVPSVVTGAMEWTPPTWWCEPYDATSASSIGMSMLYGRVGTIQDARTRLIDFVESGVRQWIKFLVGEV
jgi:glycosyltransferase involved in cell wall biosynthesis